MKQNSCCQNGSPCRTEDPVSTPEYTVHASSRRHFLSRAAKISVGVIVASSICDSLEATPLHYAPDTLELPDACCLTGSAMSTGQVREVTFPDFTEDLQDVIDADFATAPQGWSFVDHNLVVSYSNQSGSYTGSAQADVQAPPTGTRTPFDEATEAKCKLRVPSVAYEGSATITGSISGTLRFDKTVTNGPWVGYHLATLNVNKALVGNFTLVREDPEYFSPTEDITSVRYSCISHSWTQEVETTECEASATVYSQARVQLAGAGSASLAYVDEAGNNQTFAIPYSYDFKSDKFNWNDKLGIPVELKQLCGETDPVP